ncbi:helix-turn-helix transcriptional regulator [Tropicimonas aquimaris]|uniref:Response regulator transcription factor n=1 Tax=Tropicimonas aquimaris TaxID=914152 RepID=A0ABW3ISD2_9RHOB
MSMQAFDTPLPGDAGCLVRRDPAREALAELQAACARIDGLVARIRGDGTEACRRKALLLLREKSKQLVALLERPEKTQDGSAQEAEEMPPLSPREQEILGWIASGKSNAVIAEILGISPHTVDTHNRRIFRKLGAGDRTTAAIKALDGGLLPPR